MARGVFSTSNYFSSATPITNEPFTVACWFYPTSDNNVVSYLAHFNIGGTNANGWALRVDFNIANNPLVAYKILGGTSSASSVYSVIDLNAWNFGAGIYSSDDSRIGYCNGTLGSESTSTVSDASVTQLFAGCGRTVSTGNPFGPFPGYIAELVVWNVVLTEAELDNIYENKESPLLTRPGNIVSYTDFVDAREVDQFRGSVWTENGTVSVQTHPPLVYPKRSKAVTPSAITLLTQAISNSLGLSSALIKQTLTNVSNSLGLSSSVTTISDFLKTVANTLNLSSSVLKKIFTSISDSLSLTPALSTILLRFQTIANSLGLSGSLSSVSNFLKSISNTLGLSSLLTIPSIIAQAISNSLSLNSSVSTIQHMYQIIKSSSSRYIIRLRRKRKYK